jgi:ATP-dependent DNA ligase
VTELRDLKSRRRSVASAGILMYRHAGPVKDEAVTTWIRPSLVAEVKFAEWTSKGELRQPVYLGLRLDKRAKDVVRERERPRR